MLISWLRFGETRLEDRYLERAVAALGKLELDFRQHAAPAEAGQILDVLEMVAKTVQVELPEDDGLIAYVAILQDFPHAILKDMAIEILKTHSYRTMPLPAEFLDTHAAKEWTYVKWWLPRFCRINVASMQRRIEARNIGDRT